LHAAGKLLEGEFRPGGEHREWCDPGELVREAVAHAVLKGDACTMTIASDLPMIFVDVRLIEQALLTLLSNAFAHGTSKRPIEVSARRDDAELVLSVADHGPGFAPGDKPHAHPVGTALERQIKWLLR